MIQMVAAQASIFSFNHINMFYRLNNVYNKNKFLFELNEKLSPNIGYNNLSFIQQGGRYTSMPIIYFKARSKSLKLPPVGACSGIIFASKNLKQVIVENKLSGVDFFPVNVKLADGNTYDDAYYILMVSGRCGKLNYRRMKKIGTFIWGWQYKGNPIDEGTWDGSDFFMPEGTTMYLISEKAKKILSEVKPNNFQITPMDDHEMGYAPGTLPPELK